VVGGVVQSSLILTTDHWTKNDEWWRLVEAL